jgi:alkanesulfonate monooxygenase SsuD/methylene tetrahydromethanopterin reductase-like flavin-dependent oxidoreductase (luciferase family)
MALGTSVLIAPLYAPIVLARSAASLDRLSGGRFTLGLGIGWSADEYAAAGVAQRGLGARLEEILDVLDAAWGQEVVAVSTSHEVVAPSTIGLKPVRGRIPVVLAAYTAAGLDRIARRADGWTPAGVPVAAAVPMWQGALQAAEAYGRDPSTLQLVVRANVKLTPSPLGEGRQEFTGSPVEVRDDVMRARDAGVDEVLLDLQGTAHSVDHLLDATAFLASIPARQPVLAG